MQYLTDNWGRSIVVVLMIFILNVAILLTERSIYEYYSFRGINISYNLEDMYENNILMLMVVIRVAAAFIVTFPVYTGGTWWFLHTVKGEKNELKEVYVCFSNIRIYLKSLLLSLSVCICRIIVAIPVFITSFMTVKMLNYAYTDYGPDNGKFAVLTGCSAALMVCLLFVYFYYSMGFVLSSYIFVSNPDLNVFKCIKMSQMLMKDKKGELLKLYLSFIPWIFVCVLVFPVFFVVPYFYMSLTVFANEIIKKEKIIEAA